MNNIKVKIQNEGTVNTNKVILGNMEIYFSYEIPVGFCVYGEPVVCRQNDWSTTTGKYINNIQPNKGKRLEGSLFEEKLQEAISNEISRWNK